MGTQFSTSSSIPIPSITLLCIDEAFETALKAAAEAHSLPSSINITFSHTYFDALPSSTKFDLIVSPANSFGLMDGGFDAALSIAFAPQDDYLALTRVAKKALYNEYRGFAPPGSCLIVPLEGEPDLKPNDWGCKYMAISPTMKIPQAVRWDREVVFECMWTLCAAVDRHNRRVKEGGEGSEIKTMMMTPFATGCGIVSPQKWAAQTVLALKQFVEAVEKEEEWMAMSWPSIKGLHREVEKTYDL
ncbi:unnamed protein product [Periconia digitata]|uniref:Macro domain-like protein n=1 Tax=Periconia digitata TaxID=1303443 RepID=A0A9W4UVL5_9PLEO|nr:unnamed protein product [Periconia digitata]